MKLQKTPVFLIMPLVMVLIISACGGSKAIEPPAVTIIAGDVQVNGAAANDNTLVDAAAKIATGADSRGLLTYADGSTITLEPDTEISLTEAADAVSFTLGKGKVWAASNAHPFTVDAGGPKANGQNVTFSVARGGSDTTVSASGASVKFSAGGSEVEIPSGQFSVSSGGAAPSAPAEIEVNNAARFVLTGEAYIYFVDPQGRAIGYHPTAEYPVYQIPDGFYSGKAGRPQVIGVPNLSAGECTILLVAVNNQTSWKMTFEFAGKDLVFEGPEKSSSITWGTPTGITINLTFDDQGNPIPEVSNTWTLYGNTRGVAYTLENSQKRAEMNFGTTAPEWLGLP